MTLWHRHPAVRTGDQLTIGERAADSTRRNIGSWRFVGLMMLIMIVWICTGGFGADAFPFILLNLALSTLAGLQASIIMIAQNRADQISSEVAVHTLDNTTKIEALIEANTTLTQEVRDLTSQVHDLVAANAAPAVRNSDPRVQFADPAKVMEIADKLADRWSDLLNRLD